MRTLLTTSEAAKRLGICPDTMRKWEKQGVITSVRTLGNHRRYQEHDVQRLAARFNPQPQNDKGE